MTDRSSQTALKIAAGVLLCFLISTAWGLAAEVALGHSGRDRPIAVALGLGGVFQIFVAIRLWQRWRPVAIGFLIYITGEVTWMLAVLSGLVSRR